MDRITQAQIKAAETAHTAWLNGAEVKGFSPEENRRFQQAADAGKLKWTIESGVLIPITESDGEFYSDAAFNTPREAEHFTEGYGNEPGRSTPGKIAGGIFAPISQHQFDDRVRQQTRRPEVDVAQDVARGAKFALPIITQFTRKNPASAALAAGTEAAAIGLGNRGVSELRDEGYYGETLPNIAVSSAAVGASAAGNKYYSEDVVKNRQLAKHIEKQLGWPTRRYPWQSSPLEPELLPEVVEQVKSGQPYTFYDWRMAPLNRVYNELGSKALPMRMDRIPLVMEPSKEIDPSTKTYKTGAKPTSKSKGTPNWNARQWDAVCRRFIADAGLPVNTDPNEVRAFLEEAYFRPESKYGRLFYAKGGVPEGFTTEEWAALRRTDKNPVVHQLLGDKGRVIDPTADKMRADAMTEVTNRYQGRMSNKRGSVSIVTPQDYETMGTIDLKLPYFKQGKDVFRLPLRPLIRGGATVAPFAVQAVTPYVLKKFTGDSDE